MIDRPLRALKLTVPGLPSMRDAYRGPGVILERNGYENMGSILKADATPEPSRIQRVLQLLVDERLRDIHGLHNLTEAAQMIANEDQVGPKHLSSWMVQEIAEAALISELIHEIKRFQPGAPWRQALHEAAANNLMYRKSLEDRGSENITALCQNNVRSLDPSSLYYPERPRSQRHEDIVAWETQRRQVDRCLDKFWMALHMGLGQANNDGSFAKVFENVPEATVFNELYEMRFYELGNERVQASIYSPPEAEPDAPHAILSESKTGVLAGTDRTQSVPAKSQSDLEESELLRKTEEVHVGITPVRPAKNPHL